MAALVCDLCGGKLVMGAGGVAVCDSCGMEHSADRMKEKVQESKSAVRTDNSNMVSTYLEMITTALEAGNNEEAENYANKVIEIDPRCAKAWLYKGKAAGWQTTGRNNRFPESIVYWVNAHNFASDDEKAEVEAFITNEAMEIGAAILQMECNSFAGYRSDDNMEDVTNAVEMIEKQLETLKEKTEIDVYTDEFKTILARRLNSGAVTASNNADEDFGPDKRDKDEFSWRQYTSAQDHCLKLLDKAYDLCSDDSLCHTICKNYIAIATSVRDSCSYKWKYSEWNSDGIYVQEYTFTDAAKEKRTNTINNWEKKQNNHDPEMRKTNSRKAVEVFTSATGEANKKLAIKQYWETHASEKAALENELTEIEAKRAELNAEATNNGDKKQAEQIDKEIASTRAHLNSLGIFKGKEKKALAARIGELNLEKQACENRWAEAKRGLYTKERELDNRKAEISQEFTKDRGTAKITPKQNITIFTNGTGVVSALDLVSYHKAVLPEGFTVKGEGNDTVENYSRTLVLKAKAMLALFSALAGEGTDDVDLSYEDNPEAIKAYRINFQINGEDSNVSVNFTGKTIDTPIDDYICYELDEDKTPQAVANFIQVVFSSVVGICPSIDLTDLEKKIAEIAYGLAPEFTTEADNHICTISGGTKNDLNFRIEPKA